MKFYSHISYKITDKVIEKLRRKINDETIIKKLKTLLGNEFRNKEVFEKKLEEVLDKKEVDKHKFIILRYAREKKELKDHLQQVANNSKTIIKSKAFNGFDKDILSDISYLIGISHDFGKFTTYFQDKLLFDIKKDEADHSLISAFFVFELVKIYLEKKHITDSHYKYLPLLSYFVVKHHHGKLKDIEADVNANALFYSGFMNIYDQLEDMETNKDSIATNYQKLLQKYDIDFDEVFAKMEKYKEEIETFKDIKKKIGDVKTLANKLVKVKSIKYYLLNQLLYSALIDSDKKDAGRIRKIDRKEIPVDLVEKHLEKPKSTKESPINPIRNEIRESVIKNIEEKYKDNKIFTITAPTGSGKTLTGLSAALKLRKFLNDELGQEPRIIYSLPFTSIIDQNFDVFDKVLDEMDEFENNKNKSRKSQYLIKHHYLADISYKVKNESKEPSVDESLALIESWESEIIVTTFIQLFHSLIGYKNRSLKKFHNIVNSIILLDEVQNIPIEYWELVRKMLKAMTEYFNCRIILMTATKPLIFDTGEYIELVENFEDHFKATELNRVKLKIDTTPKTIEKFYNGINFNKKSYLFVFNTIKSSLEFYELIKEKEADDYKVFYLSTNIIPKERKERIEEIRKKNESENDNKNKFIVVSTQMIEAGVDIDCECVYRDLAPLDSIIQVAGRCNRNKKEKNNTGEVNLVTLVKETERDNPPKFAGYIYDPVLLDIVHNVLKGKNEIPETEFLSLINDYFEKAKAKSAEERKILDSICRLYFYDKNFDMTKRKPISEFHLIQEDYYKVDIFVEADENAKEIWERYQENKKLPVLERRNGFLKFRKDFYDYVISVPRKESLGLVNEDEYLGRIDKDQINCYDNDTGFIREGTSKKITGYVLL